uniref:Uncharacterized protein n=1 Tax=viral metagenome TaxID=1070528 RepID=A0A6C0F686_9ZZZZ
MIRLLLSYGNDEYLPVLLGYGHNLKEENICEGELTELEKYDLTTKYKIQSVYKSKELNIFLTYSKKELIDCHIMLDDVKIPIIDYRRYCSLQIGKFCYDDIHVFRLNNSIIV